MNFLLDTNVICNYIKGTYEGKARQFTDAVINETTYISVISRIELLSWKTIQVSDEAIVEDFIKDSIVILLNESVIMKPVELRRAYRIKIPDAIIAATAIIQNLQLVTHNTNDFILIKELILINPLNLTV